MLSQLLALHVKTFRTYATNGRHVFPCTGQIPTIASMQDPLVAGPQPGSSDAVKAACAAHQSTLPVNRSEERPAMHGSIDS